MHYQSFYRRLENEVQNLLPEPAHSDLLNNLDHLISPHRLQLSPLIYERCQSAIEAHWKALNSTNLKVQLENEYPILKSAPFKIDSPLMAYDFHTTENGEAFLVEINTNASAYLLSCLAYLAHGESTITKSALEELKKSFLDQLSPVEKRNPYFIISDENLFEQKMLLEFVLYKNLIESWGFKCELIDAHDLTTQKIQDINQSHHCVIYNRTTDFYFESQDLKVLADLYTQKRATVFPHPWAYATSADKLRLSELSSNQWRSIYQIDESEIKPLLEVIIPTFTPSQLGSIEKIWSDKKSLFFKPRQAYGGKSVYRGQSISRKVFDRIMSENTLIQKFIPAQSWPNLDQMNFMENWKFDLRFYVYKGKIQLAIARSYQGQVTNFSSPYGGLTAVQFVSN